MYSAVYVGVYMYTSRQKKILLKYWCLSRRKMGKCDDNRAYKGQLDFKHCEIYISRRQRIAANHKLMVENWQTFE